MANFGTIPLAIISVMLIGAEISFGQSPLCASPRDNQGQCVEITQCPNLLQALQKRPLTEEVTTYMRQSSCGPNSATQVCCERSSSYCVTPDDKAGSCVPLNSCDTLLTMLTRQPLTEDVKTFLRNSQCNSAIGGINVCCPFSSKYKNADVVAPRFFPQSGDCGKQGIIDRIIGGEQAAIDEFPWMALLEYDRNGETSLGCGGVLISNRYVLTASHCVKGRAVKQLGELKRVRLGEYDTKNVTDCVVKPGGYLDCSTDPIITEIEQIIPHRGWIETDPNHPNDIALLRLKTPVEFNDFIKPVCLPWRKFQNRIGDEVYVSGWGATEKKSFSNVKLKLKVRMADKDACALAYKNKVQPIRLASSQICAGGEANKDSCKGDSGGPLLKSIAEGTDTTWYSIGVVSIGPFPCGLEGVPGIYTNVEEHLPWIVKNVRQ